MPLPSMGRMWSRSCALMFPYADIHCHDRSRYREAVINLFPHDEIIEGAFHSVGIHPWHTSNVDDDTISRLQALAAHPQIVAIGEAGLDALKGAPLDTQTEIFLLHVTLSEQYQKPLIIHCVKAFNEIIALKKRLRPSMPWIIHGFRGKPQLATQLLNNGFYISLGKHYNPDTAAIIPHDRLFHESDENSF